MTTTSRRVVAAIAVAVAAVAVTLALSGEDMPEDLEPLTLQPPEATDVCAAGDFPRLQSGTHLLGGTEPPVPWTSTPATSGWHTAGLAEVANAPDPIDDADLVAQLEAGAVAALHDDRLPADQLARLEDMAATSHDGRLVVAAYEGELDTPLVLVGWGVLQSCDRLDEAAVTDFVLRYTGLAEVHG